MTHEADDAAAMTHDADALVADLFHSIADLKLKAEGLQAQLTGVMQARGVDPPPDTYKDPVSQVNELMQKNLLATVTETQSHTGPDHERVHTCSWAIDGTLGEVISATGDTVKLAKKNCALLYLEYHEQTA